MHVFRETIRNAKNMWRSLFLSEIPAFSFFRHVDNLGEIYPAVLSQKVSKVLGMWPLSPALGGVVGHAADVKDFLRTR